MHGRATPSEQHDECALKPIKATVTSKMVLQLSNFVYLSLYIIQASALNCHHYNLTQSSNQKVQRQTIRISTLGTTFKMVNECVFLLSTHITKPLNLLFYNHLNVQKFTIPLMVSSGSTNRLYFQLCPFWNHYSSILSQILSNEALVSSNSLPNSFSSI